MGKFLAGENLSKDPLLYQYITDQTFEMLIKKCLPSKDESTEELEAFEQALTYEEGNAVRYTGGYVIPSLVQSSKDDGVKHVLCELKDDSDDGEDGPASDWVKAVNRGGLIKISTEAYQCFYAIEICIRRQLKTSNTDSMNDGFRQRLKDMMVSDDDILFYWTLAGQIEGDETADKCLALMCDKWITIRGFSFAKNIMELYKQESKKGTAKSKSLRSTLCT